MEASTELFHEQDEFESDDKPPSFLPPYRPPTRLHIQRSSICSRAYFVVVMVFFHLYILNVIGLLLYVHYYNVSPEMMSGERVVSAPDSGSESTPPRPPLRPAPLSEELHVMEHSLTLHRFEGIRVGHVQQVSIVPGRNHQMKTVSLKPLLFEIQDFLSEEECRVVVQLARLKGLMESQPTAPGGPLLSLSTQEVFSLLDLNQDGLLQKQEIVSHSRSQDGTWLNPENLRQILTGLDSCPTGTLTFEDFSRVFELSKHAAPQLDRKLHSGFKQRSKHTWLYQGPGSHHVLRSFRNRLSSLTRLSAALLELSEPLQVIRYEQGDFSHAHHDSSPAHADTTCSHTRLAGNTSALTEVPCRYLTMQVHLSSVEEGGETTFPVADNRTYEEQALRQDGVDLTDTQQTCDRGNLRLRPSAGTALLWYNHLSDGRGWMGELDEYSLHGDCPLRRGLKWLANSWVNVDPDQQQQARYQRLVAQRHQSRAAGVEQQEEQQQQQQQPLSHSDLHHDL